jgi:transposase
MDFGKLHFLNQETGKCGERQLDHSDGEAERFYREITTEKLACRGMEASGYARWSERLLAELGFELWNGLISQDPSRKWQPRI